LVRHWHVIENAFAQRCAVAHNNSGRKIKSVTADVFIARQAVNAARRVHALPTARRRHIDAVAHDRRDATASQPCTLGRRGAASQRIVTLACRLLPPPARARLQYAARSTQQRSLRSRVATAAT